jgi:hypothetical protein
LAAIASFAVQTALAQAPSFSGAEGYGGTFTGSAPAGGWFSNATVYHVTNLNDSGAGSLRGAFVENTANKIIVFDVAGTINLTTDNIDIKNLANYYIAGQTAPGPVTIYGDMVQLTHSSGKQNSNVVLRYLTFRKGTGANEDSITFAGSGLGTNLILDHVSASWSEDEVLSVANNNTNVTVQYSMINDALVSNHAYGSLIRPRINSSVSFHHNLYANNASRQARFGTYDAMKLTADFRNNVVYNWRDRASYAGGSSEAEQEFVDVNYVGNYLVAGPSTTSNASTAFIVDKNVDVRAYQSGNFIDSDRALNPGGQPNGADTGWGMFAFSTPITDQTLAQMGSPFATPAVTTQSAINAYNQVVNHVGNSWWQRDAIDARVINNVLTNTGSVGAAAPNAAELNGVLTAPQGSRPAGWDTDNDGIPNSWETAHGLNPNSPVATPDWKLDFDNDGYINLLEYVNEVGDFPAPAQISFNGATNNRYAVITNWKTNDGGITSGSNWQPSRFDEALISSGTVTVDAAGQHAGILLVGGAPANNPTLVVSSGWLKVENDLVIGGFGVIGNLSLSGGTLRTKTLQKPSGTFNFTGGKLSADTVNFSLTSNGGTLAPGDGIGATQNNIAPTNIGQTHVVGDLTLASGNLQIELASLASFDKLLVSGTAALGGGLAVSTLGGFTPTNGNSWQIITAGGITGSFSSVTPGYTVQQQGNNLVLFFGPPTLAGDYNGDGIVSAGDYVTWRRAMDSGGTLLNETASIGTVDQADYAVWRANIGSPGAGSGSTAGASAVPEPPTALLVFSAFYLLLVRKNRSGGQ